MQSLSSIFVILCLAATANAQSVIATFQTTFEGGVANQADQLMPIFEFRNHQHTLQPLQQIRPLSQGDSTTYTVTDPTTLQSLGELLRTDDILMNTGHTIGNINSALAHEVKAAFQHPNLANAIVEGMEITFSNVKISNSASNGKNWTDFSYTVSVRLLTAPAAPTYLAGQ